MGDYEDSGRAGECDLRSRECLHCCGTSGRSHCTGTGAYNHGGKTEHVVRSRLTVITLKARCILFRQVKADVRQHDEVVGEA